MSIHDAKVLSLPIRTRALDDAMLRRELARLRNQREIIEVAIEVLRRWMAEVGLSDCSTVWSRARTQSRLRVYRQ